MSGTPTLILLVFVSLVCLFFLIGLSLGSFRNYITQNSDNQAIFLTGTIPTDLPDGLYKGSVNAETSWQGKKFDRETQTGINLFNTNDVETENYPFKTYVGRGLADPSIEVIKIDYNLSGNPFWLRFVLDEIVLTDTGRFLGKLHVKVGPIHFALGFFTLEHF